MVSATLERSYSEASKRTLVSLRELDLEVRSVEDELLRCDESAAREPVKTRQALAQVVGQLDRLQFAEIDAVLTSDLTSGKSTARHYRKSLHSRIDAMRAHVDDLLRSDERLEDQHLSKSVDVECGPPGKSKKVAFTVPGEDEETTSGTSSGRKKDDPPPRDGLFSFEEDKTKKNYNEKDVLLSGEEKAAQKNERVFFDPEDDPLAQVRRTREAAFLARHERKKQAALKDREQKERQRRDAARKHRLAADFDLTPRAATRRAFARALSTVRRARNTGLISQAAAANIKRALVTVHITRPHVVDLLDARDDDAVLIALRHVLFEED